VKPPRTVKVILRDDSRWPAFYEAWFTCGHTEFSRRDERYAAALFFGRVCACLECDRERDV